MDSLLQIYYYFIILFLCTTCTCTTLVVVWQPWRAGGQSFKFEHSLNQAGFAGTRVAVLKW
jgi:hypothetical protein